MFQARLAAAAVLVLGWTTTTALAVPYNDRHGREWQQLTATRGATWQQAAIVLPQDGFTPGAGILGAIDVIGWT